MPILMPDSGAEVVQRLTLLNSSPTGAKTVGKFANQKAWSEHEQQSRRQYREDDDQREEFDEWLPERLGDEVELMDGGW
jgi:hypothetical protein